MSDSKTVLACMGTTPHLTVIICSHMKLSEVYEIEHFAIYHTDENDHRIHIKSNGELRDVIARLREANGAENKLVIKLQLEKILKTEPVSSVANNTPGTYHHFFYCLHRKSNIVCLSDYNTNF